LGKKPRFWDPSDQSRLRHLSHTLIKERSNGEQKRKQVKRFNESNYLWGSDVRDA
jgi:hypothetical protein